MVHYTHVLRGLAVRRQASDFSLQVDSSLALGRPLPADQGLNVQQLQELFRLFDLPACVYDVRDLPQTLEWLPQDPAGPRHLWTTITRASRHDHPGNWDRRIYPTVCRFLNSGFPVIVTTRTHAFVLVGYYRTVQGNGRPDRITFIRNDDAAGPYIEVPDVFDDVDAGRRHTPWDCLIVPLPPKLWLLCEAAEAEGGTVLRSFLKNARTCDVAACDELVRRMDARRLALRTYATASNSYKLGLVERDIDPVVLREYRLARLPRYIWVVEAIDCELREKHEPSTVGEVLLDATSSSLYPTTLAVHIAGGVRVYDPSQAEAGTSPPDPRPTPIDEGPMGAPEGPSAASLAGESAPDAHELLRCGAKAYVTGAPGIHPARR
jgi:hypothetical protein